jgi:hypothetical protein
LSIIFTLNIKAVYNSHMEQDPSENATPQERTAKFQDTEPAVGGLAVYFSDHTIHEPQLPNTRHELAPIPPFPFGRRAEDEQISLESAEEDYLEYRASWHRSDVPNLGFHVNNQPQDAADQPLPPGELPDHDELFNDPHST